MKKFLFHEKWGHKYGLSTDSVDYTYSIIEDPINQTEYLHFLAKVTQWWDDNDIEYIPGVIKKDCKTAEERINSERQYKDYLSAHLQGIKAGDKASGLNAFQRKHLDPKAAKCTMFQNLFFNRRITGRDISRVKDIGDFQSNIQQKYLRPRGPSYLQAYYLHHLIDYCHEYYLMLSLTNSSLSEIIKRNKERVKPIDPGVYDEVASFVQQHVEELKHDFETD